MKRPLSARLETAPQGEIRRRVLRRLRHLFGTPSFNRRRNRALEHDLLQRFERYKVDNLKGINPQDFRNYIESQIGKVDLAVEGYDESELEKQRDLSMKFHWGHDHDFGTFALTGKAGNSYIKKVAAFCTFFDVSLSDFDDKDVLDIGCWTGGTTLMLAALGARVTAIEEVKKYAHMVNFLAESFGIQDRLKALPQSLYACNDESFYDRFDIVFFPGVLYHLSDPVLGLRILFNTLKTGGFVLVESAGIDDQRPVCSFGGSMVHLRGSKKDMDRSGWSYFRPSRSAMERMILEAGFEDVSVKAHPYTGRMFGYGRKNAQVGICRAGLSVPDIR